MILSYPKGHTITEGTWTQPAMPVKIPAMVYGDKGAIAIMSSTELKIATKGIPGQHQGLPIEGETIAAPELPAHYKPRRRLLHLLPAPRRAVHRHRLAGGLARYAGDP